MLWDLCSQGVEAGRGLSAPRACPVIQEGEDGLVFDLHLHLFTLSPLITAVNKKLSILG